MKKLLIVFSLLLSMVVSVNCFAEEAKTNVTESTVKTEESTTSKADCALDISDNGKVNNCLVAVHFTQPNCIPDVDDKWFDEVAEIVKERIEAKGLKAKNQFDVWEEFINQPGEEEPAQFNTYATQQNFNGVVNVSVSRYVTKHGVTDVAVTIEGKHIGEEASYFTVTNTKSNVQGTERMDVLKECISTIL